MLFIDQRVKENNFEKKLKDLEKLKPSD